MEEAEVNLTTYSTIMNEAKKQHIKRSMQDTVRHLAEAIESMKAAADIANKYE